MTNLCAVQVPDPVAHINDDLEECDAEPEAGGHTLALFDLRDLLRTQRRVVRPPRLTRTDDDGG